MPRNVLLALTGCALLLAGIGCAGGSSAQPPLSASTPLGVANLRQVSSHAGDYLPAHTIKLEIDGAIVGAFKGGGFKEISGLESEVEVIEFKDGDDPIAHRRAGKAKYKNIVLKRGVLADNALAAWAAAPTGEKTERKSGSVIYLDREGSEVLRYSFFEAWPCRWKAPELNANADTFRAYEAHLVEELEFVVEKVERARYPLPPSIARHDTPKNAIGNIR